MEKVRPERFTPPRVEGPVTDLVYGVSGEVNSYLAVGVSPLTQRPVRPL